MSTDGTGAAAGRTRGRPSRAALAWLAVIGLIGIVQLARGQWGDAALFGAAGVVVAVSALSTRRAGRHAGRPAAPVIASGAVLLIVALSVVPRHSVWALIAVVITGAAAAVTTWRQPAADDSRAQAWTPALRTLAWSWAAIVIVASLWELLQVTLGRILPGGRAAYPALSDLLDPLVTPPIGQTLFAMCWVALGVFLATRGGRR